MITLMSSVRCAILGLAASGFVAGTFAQTVPPQALPQNDGAGIRSGNITSTGETVPNPGASQSAGTTAMDKGIEREDTKIQSSICKGC